MCVLLLEVSRHLVDSIGIAAIRDRKKESAAASLMREDRLNTV